MSSSDIAISIRGLGKSYTIAHQRSSHTRITEALADLIRNRGRRTQTETFWALRDVSFDIHRGDVVGIIGRNGAGKSTLLKLISRITEPTTGAIDLYGRVGSLLEVGTGFHPELTGRENIFLNGAILGMTRAEVRRHFDEIVAFAGIDQFLDTPVKRYSSGMYVRLAFAVAAYLRSDILIVDEVLAVGDATFQRKCIGKMQDIATSGGRTVLFVSHSMAAIQQLCSRAVYLERGTVHTAGRVPECIDAYLGSGAGVSSKWERDATTPSKPFYFEQISVRLGGAQPGHRLEVEVSCRSAEPHPPAFLAVDILDSTGTAIMQALPTLERFIRYDRPAGRFLVCIDLPPMIPGHYFLSVWAGPHNNHTADMVVRAVEFEVTESPMRGRVYPHSGSHGFIVPQSTVETTNGADINILAVPVGGDR